MNVARARADFCIIADASRDYNRVAYLSRGMSGGSVARLTARVRRLINDFLREDGAARARANPVGFARSSALWIPPAGRSVLLRTFR